MSRIVEDYMRNTGIFSFFFIFYSKQQLLLFFA